MLKKKLGVRLMSWGAQLCLNSDEDKNNFKMAINGNTTIGSYADSGDHLRDHINPMCDYDTQSVVNVLKQELLLSGNNQVKHSSVKLEYYKENWKN